VSVSGVPKTINLDRVSASIDALMHCCVDATAIMHPRPPMNTWRIKSHSSPASPSSPLSRPPYIPASLDIDAETPGELPPFAPGQPSDTYSRIGHSTLGSLSQFAQSSPAPGKVGRLHFPVLSPSNPLRGKMFPVNSPAVNTCNNPSVPTSQKYPASHKVSCRLSQTDGSSKCTPFPTLVGQVTNFSAFPVACDLTC